MKDKPGKVQAPESRPWLWKDLFRQKAQQKFAGTDGSMETLKSEDGMTKIAEAKAETTAALGYSLEEAVKEDELEDLHRELQYSKKELGGEEGLCCETEAMDVM